MVYGVVPNYFSVSVFSFVGGRVDVFLLISKVSFVAAVSESLLVVGFGVVEGVFVVGNFVQTVVYR